MKRALMCPPAFYTVRDVKNPFMLAAEPVDGENAMRQWNDVRAAFERAGVATLTIEPVADLEDMVFAANLTFVGRGKIHSQFIVPSRMRYASRQREVAHYVRWFSERGYDALDLDLERFGGFLEGHGDLLWQPQSKHVWAGYGWRSSRSGVEAFACAVEAEGIDVTPLHLVDPNFYHLDTCLAPLNADAALWYPGAFAAEARESLRRGRTRLHEVGRDDALAFACNGVAVNGRFIASHISAALAAVVTAEGLEPLLVDTSEFEKAGGSVFCMKAFLNEAP